MNILRAENNVLIGQIWLLPIFKNFYCNLVCIELSTKVIIFLLIVLQGFYVIP